MDVYNVYLFECYDIVVQVVVYMLDLLVEFLCEYDVEGLLFDFFYLVFFGYGVQDGNIFVYMFDKGRVDGFIDGDDVFFFVFVLFVQDFVDDVVVVGQKNQFGGSFVEVADVENVFWVVEEVDDVGFIFVVSGVGDVGRFVEGKVDCFGFSFEGCIIQ